MQVWLSSSGTNNSISHEKILLIEVRIEVTILLEVSTFFFKKIKINIFF